MKKVRLYPTLAETLEFHTHLIKRFGGKYGVRDLGFLESALMRPQAGYYKTLSPEAAALLQSLCHNDSFIDGNERVAFATTAVFLRMNGYRLKVNADLGEEFLIERVIKKKAEIDDIATWLEAQMMAV